MYMLHYFSQCIVPIFYSIYLQVCHQVLLDLQHCLAYTKPFPNGSDCEMKGGQVDLEHLSIFEEGEENKERPEYLKDDLIFKMIAMLLLCVTKLQAGGRFGFVVCSFVNISFNLAVNSRFDFILLTLKYHVGYLHKYIYNKLHALCNTTCKTKESIDVHT